MSEKAIIKILIDIGMIISLMFLMAFELVGREAHEWIGMAMFVLFLVHHALKSYMDEKYPQRSLNAISDFSAFTGLPDTHFHDSFYG